MGVTQDRDKPYVSSLTLSHPHLIRDINNAIAPFLVPLNVKWGSLQINVNTICQTHVDKNNIGPSFLALLGKLSGGKFISSDPRYSLS